MAERDSSDVSAGELISLAEAAELCGLSPGHLSYLVRTGQLWGTKIGRNWATTAAAVREYMAQDRRPGPKPAKDCGPFCLQTCNYRRYRIP